MVFYSRVERSRAEGEIMCVLYVCVFLMENKKKQVGGGTVAHLNKHVYQKAQVLSAQSKYPNEKHR